MGKTQEEAYALLEEMSINSYQWLRERQAPRKVMGIQDNEAISTLTMQVQKLSEQVKAMNTMPQSFQEAVLRCDWCGGQHRMEECQLGNPFQPSHEVQAN